MGTNGTLIPGERDETRVRYAEPSVAIGQQCQAESQTRLCTDGTFGPWSGTLTFETCVVQTAGSCGSTPDSWSPDRSRRPPSWRSATTRTSTSNGLAISVGWIIYRYGRPHELGNPPKGDDR